MRRTSLPFFYPLYWFKQTRKARIFIPTSNPQRSEMRDLESLILLPGYTFPISCIARRMETPALRPAICRNRVSCPKPGKIPRFRIKLSCLRSVKLEKEEDFYRNSIFYSLQPTTFIRKLLILSSFGRGEKKERDRGWE